LETYNYVIVESGIPSSSSDATYTVKIRLDTRLELPERIREAALTCNCPGWTKRAKDGRTCRHVRENEDILEKFIEENIGRLENGRFRRLPMWTPDILRAGEAIEKWEEVVISALNLLRDPERITEALAGLWQAGKTESAMEMLLSMKNRLRENTENVDALLSLIGV
jgi:hypothetical protein